MEELNSGPPKTNPSSAREEDLNPGPPDYKSSALHVPLGHARLLIDITSISLSVFHYNNSILSELRDYLEIKLVSNHLPETLKVFF